MARSQHLVATDSLVSTRTKIYSVASARKNPVVLLGLLFAFLCVGGFSVNGAEKPQPAQIKLVAPGIWQIRFGKPEALTPSHFQTSPAMKENLKMLPGVENPSLDVNKIHFEVSDQGCVVQIPLEANETIYGFGLNTALFDMTQTEKGHTGRRVFLKPTDHPENELGESHAPVPFYCSSGGYGVFVDTARFASFYTGNVASPEKSARKINAGRSARGKGSRCLHLCRANDVGRGQTV